jgi:hypothetical protein
MSTEAGGPGGSAFRRDGYALLKGFLTAEELRLLGPEIDAVHAAPRGPSCERPNNTLVPLRWDDAIVSRVLTSEQRTDRLTATVDADDLRWISGYLSIKEPRSPALWWHQDWWCWDHPVSYRREPSQVALLCYLSPTTAATAALRVVPGSHHRGMPAAEAPRDAKTLALNAGDAVLIDYRLLHATHPNAGDVRRDCLILNFAPAWRSLPADVRAHLIRHPALPGRGEADVRPRYPMDLLPAFAGEPRDLPLSRVPPAWFAI